MSKRRRRSEKCVITSHLEIDGKDIFATQVMLGKTTNTVTIRIRRQDGGLVPILLERSHVRRIGLPGLRIIQVGDVTEFRRPPDRPSLMKRLRRGLPVKVPYDDLVQNYREGL